MEQNLPNDEIHALHIVNLGVVAGKSSEHVTQILVSLASYFEKRVFRKCSTEVSFNLRGRLRNGLQFRQTLKVRFAFRIFTQNCRPEDSLLKLVQVDLFLLASRCFTNRLFIFKLFLLLFQLFLIFPQYFLLQHSVGEPLGALLAPKFIVRILLTRALNLRLCLFELCGFLFCEDQQLIWCRKRPRHLDRALLIFSC